MAVTPINSEDRLVQATFADHLERVLDWDSIYAWNQETFGLDGTLGRADTKEAVLTRDLRAALERLNPDLPASAIEVAVREMAVYLPLPQLAEQEHVNINDGLPEGWERRILSDIAETNKESYRAKELTRNED